MIISERLLSVFARANELAKAMRRTDIGVPHVLIALLEVSEENPGKEAIPLMALEGDGSHLIAFLKGDLLFGNLDSAADTQLPKSPPVKNLIAASFSEVSIVGGKQLDTEHLLLAFLKMPDAFGADILIERGVSYSDSWRRILETGRCGPAVYLLKEYLLTSVGKNKEPQLLKRLIQANGNAAFRDALHQAALHLFPESPE